MPCTACLRETTWRSSSQAGVVLNCFYTNVLHAWHSTIIHHAVYLTQTMQYPIQNSPINIHRSRIINSFVGVFFKPAWIQSAKGNSVVLQVYGHNLVLSRKYFVSNLIWMNTYISLCFLHCYKYKELKANKQNLSNNVKNLSYRKTK